MLMILIPGLILVALMVYASTRIKKAAALAFEAEKVETDEFTLDKPAGFLNVLNRDPSLAFQAYSREIGVDEASEFRAARAEARVYDGSGLGKTLAGIKETVDVTSDISEVIGGHRYQVLEAETVEKGVGFRVCYKLSENGGRVYEFKTITLLETDDDIKSKIETMFLSFTVK